MRISKLQRQLFFVLLLLIAQFIGGIRPAMAAPVKKLDLLPLSERWFGIYADNKRVGFYRQKITETPDGYRFEGISNVRITLMGYYSKNSSIRETYLVEKNLALRTFEVEQVINGQLSRVTGKVNDTSLRIKSESNGKSTDKLFRLKYVLYPGPALNLYPLMHDVTAGKSYRLQTFDPEELKVKDVTINVMGYKKTPDGQSALKLRNNLYPFVTNDVWVDKDGNTVFESVRDGLVMIKAEDPKTLGAFVGNSVIAGKDLIHDFSLVRAEPPIRKQKKLKGLVLEITGWNDSLKLQQDGGQTMTHAGKGRIAIRTGSARIHPPAAAVDVPEVYLKPAEGIEPDAPEIISKARDIAEREKKPSEVVTALASWTAEWLTDSLDDGGALSGLKSRHGNCQTRVRLYTALARSMGIPTRFVSGLVSLEGKGFVYHSWAESLIDGKWIAIDPTYKQIPADPTHLKLFEGHSRDDMATIITIIGKIRIHVLEMKHK